MSGLALGIMSGTSGDGVSLALARFSARSYRLLKYKTYPYPNDIAKTVLNPDSLSVSELSSLNFRLGKIYGECAIRFLKENRIHSSKVAVIGSHGQTLLHAPKEKIPSTLQSGESSVLAEMTGITVVSNFRERDIAAGGEGAPLIPHFDLEFFGHGKTRSLLNLGGMANITVVKNKRIISAFDTGPGNCLMDYKVNQMTRGRKGYDKSGVRAKTGTIDMGLVQKMAAHPYFLRKPPKSTGREIFNSRFIPKHANLATLTYFTAYTVWRAHLDFVKEQPHEIIVSGGGACNETLMEHLQCMFSPTPVVSIECYGISPQAKEPLAFAYFAWQAISGKINHAPQGTGARGSRILGKITPGANFKGVR
ncbi:MAG: hypothetical protein A2901_01890 [Elusimicrobia bacterium RIFCSPLOWO2_01_FULL_54_10]|nr:MAG: hypothetical protein A2901_01890 [Elusimicrobia bacterium RIFCSPLOWO2_01_FULL_54_10]